MTVRFGNYRLAFYVIVFLLSGTVLGLTAHFASIFLPKLHHDFIIFSLVVSSLTIFVHLLSIQWAQPRTEAVQLFILGTLWLAMGAWATDIIGHVQCDGLGGQRIPTKDGNASYRDYCYEMTVIEAFSWMNFALFVIAFAILLSLITQAQRFGRYLIWREPIRELPWFGEVPGYYNTHTGVPAQYPGGYMPYGYPATGGQMVQPVTQVPVTTV
ncbi:hypothetical protein AMATHDRAFT_56113 [Amanita thiersii Skay4041]|uniref:MARVEL domain-containing protein n=1 Tax=Amanita thiersii Skay4041 TaxID=703135 RepID=A0A2A9NRJ3_9AGAR|nr:hypothetical protein AMATHDRAFT_56113 [Amanita thiersii Skay4041]